jgi:hypothetical protein
LAGTDPESVWIVLDMFSGKPNPSWRLDREQSKELLNRLRVSRRLPQVEDRKPRPGLGYRGLIATIATGSESESWRICNGSIEHKGEYFEDFDRDIEALILQSMPQELTTQFSNDIPSLGGDR